ncbi:methyltransferase domain-containing protein (plasmid) [Streptomyces clavuligerus]|uniref:protein-L-isoaspartate O-methyltransferase family protein n=1 Tax=Streptomyces clavuligerus TaxID=1901 RepID=UPI00017FF61E|nr:methyltransferase domain-containing protein [Streptomyces clavuligerus]EDY48884.1 protein-L-isoaspartate(D-aspartate) O-methyltransferase [Streptomyces clavuligerus]MBY6307518.1 methyltransferase domain-containing protein [Streptomyces clavuligerus]QCS10909.1 methyltransferase domain-containing protein [Streptomyces clavuligerus]QPJ98499.1 methyltransferase domain-containing protein [Streptomyces clavuligerus]
MLAGRWTAVFTAVDRAAFTPDTVYAEVPGPGRRYEEVTRDGQRARWAELVASPGAVVTRLGRSPVDGLPVPSSSSSAPAAVAAMVTALDLTPGDRVLDLGTGTGWVAALLAAYGARVTTVEADAHVAAEAAVRLAGYEGVTTVHGDAVQDHDLGDGFDAVHAGFAVRRIPLAWLIHTEPGARIVAPYGTLWSPTGLARLVRDTDGSATGHFSRTAVTFMWEHGQQPHWPEPDQDDARMSASPVDPRELLRSPAGRWATGLQLPDVTYDPVPARGDRMLRLWSLDGSTAAVHVDHWADPEGVAQTGRRSLWDEAVTALNWWTGQARPARDRFGLTTTPGGDTLWLDHPGQPVPNPATRAAEPAPT